MKRNSRAFEYERSRFVALENQCDKLGITLIISDLGNLKAFLATSETRKILFVNRSLSEKEVEQIIKYLISEK